MARTPKPETLAREALNDYLSSRVATAVSTDGILGALADAGLTIAVTGAVIFPAGADLTTKRSIPLPKQEVSK